MNKNLYLLLSIKLRENLNKITIKNYEYIMKKKIIKVKHIIAGRGFVTPLYFFLCNLILLVFLLLLFQKKQVDVPLFHNIFGSSENFALHRIIRLISFIILSIISMNHYVSITFLYGVFICLLATT